MLKSKSHFSFDTCVHFHSLTAFLTYQFFNYFSLENSLHQANEKSYYFHINTFKTEKHHPVLTKTNVSHYNYSLNVSQDVYYVNKRRKNGKTSNDSFQKPKEIL